MFYIIYLCSLNFLRSFPLCPILYFRGNLEISNWSSHMHRYLLVTALQNFSLQFLTGLCANWDIDPACSRAQQAGVGAQKYNKLRKTHSVFLSHRATVNICFAPTQTHTVSILVLHDIMEDWAIPESYFLCKCNVYVLCQFRSVKLSYIVIIWLQFILCNFAILRDCTEYYRTYTDRIRETE